MSIVNYKCPCCGGPLAFSGASGKLECAACGNSFDTEALEVMNVQPEAGRVEFDMEAEVFGAGDGMAACACKNCGAELVMDGTTAATECPYCGSPIVLSGRLEGGVKPEKVVPFVVTKEQAKKQFEDYFQGKRMLPNVFKSSANHIAEMRRIFIPYWLFDCEAEASAVYDAEKTTTSREDGYEVTRTRHYLLRREGDMSFRNIPVDGSTKLDEKIAESLEPFDLTKAVPFTPAVLAGAMADSADIEAEACKSRAVARVERSVENALSASVSGYSNLRARQKRVSSKGGKATPVLLPVWVITTDKDGKTYTFAINGQTGELTCDVPYDKRQATKWGVGVFAAVFAGGYLLLSILRLLGVMG